jgi:hypothetical protein
LSGHPAAENGSKADENQVSKTSSSYINLNSSLDNYLTCSSISFVVLPINHLSSPFSLMNSPFKNYTL